MVYLNYSNLDDETQQRLLSISRKEVESRFGNDLLRYSKEQYANYDELLEEEVIKNLYSLKIKFNI
tara:strand:+ start:101 stop:298 length:198 start_codon:yes stop_codon:yes gene_type:complete